MAYDSVPDEGWGGAISFHTFSCSHFRRIKGFSYFSATSFSRPTAELESLLQLIKGRSQPQGCQNSNMLKNKGKMADLIINLLPGIVCSVRRLKKDRKKSYLA